MPKYFKKLFFFSLFIALLPIISWGALSYYLSTESITNLFSLQNKQSLEQSKLKVEQILETIDYSVTQYMLSSSFRLFNYALDIPDFAEIKELQEGMRKLQIERFGVEEIVLLNHEKDWTITNEEFYSSSQAGPGDDLFKQFKNLPHTSMWVVDNVNGKRKIRLVKKIPLLTNTIQPKGLLIVNIDENKINNLISQNVKIGNCQRRN